MRNIFFGIIIAFVLVFFLRYCEQGKDERQRIEANTALIQKELNNVGKLIVTEGSYAQVFTEKDTKQLFMGLVESKKKAIVIVNAKAQISYDLSKVETQIDEENKTVYITKIPEYELSINPNIEYYDVQQEYLNQFDATDYNKIKTNIEKSLRNQIEKSELVTNAENRLISELSKIYILTNSMGWTLKYQGELINQDSDFKIDKPKNYLKEI